MSSLLDIALPRSFNFCGEANLSYRKEIPMKHFYPHLLQSLILVCSTLLFGVVAAATPVSIVLSPDAPSLERHAAEELQVYVEKLFGLEAPIETSANEDVPHFRIATTPNAPDAQSITLRREGETFLITGGSPVATLWAVYELVDRWGVRYLYDRDVLPAPKPWAGLPDWDVTMTPNMRIRCWRLVNDLASGPISWSLAENQRFLRQMAKMKYNRIHVSLWPMQPFVHYEFQGMEKPPGVLNFGAKFPIDDDTVGREKFGDVNYFMNPELQGSTSPEDLNQRGIGLIRGILKEARALGMETGLSIQPFEWPKQFMEVMPESEPVNQLGMLTAGPGHAQSMDDPLLRDMIATIIRAYIETYPDVDYLHLNTPEHRSWVSQAESAVEKFQERFPEMTLGSYDELCARARARTSFPGGGERVEKMLKGDVASLWFLDSLIRERDLLKRPNSDEQIKIVYTGIVAELFPLVEALIPPGGEILSFIDYTASRQLKQRDLLRQTPKDSVPATLTFTLADDNVGVLPQLATGSLHQLMGDLRQSGWAGFYTRYWTASDLNPTIHYLARASWDTSVTPQSAYRDQFSTICGKAATGPALEALALLEEITLGLDQHGLGFGFPVPSMMTKHFSAGGLSAPLKADHGQYRLALEKMEAAHERATPAGKDYTGYYVGRLRFAVRYLDAAEAFGATSVALKAEDTAEARKQIGWAYEAIREALQAYVDGAGDHGDLGAVALMNEYCYRPIRDKKQELGG